MYFVGILFVGMPKVWHTNLGWIILNSVTVQIMQAVARDKIQSILLLAPYLLMHAVIPPYV